MNEFVRGYAAATVETAAASGHLEAVVHDLEVFAGALNQSIELRRVLTDSSIPPLTRRGVVADLVGGKAVPEAAALVGFAVRLERPAELSPLIHGLIEFAERGGDGPELGAAPASRQITRERIRGYAERVLEELSALGEVDEVEDELFRTARLVADHPELRVVLTDISRPVADRVAIAAELLADRARPATVRLVTYVLRAGHVRDLVGTIEWLVALAAEERGRRLAEVHSAIELDPAEVERLGTALQRLVGRPVEVRVIIDPNVVGGLLVDVGDLVIDGTVRLRVERFRELLSPQV